MDFWQRARTFAEETAKRSQEFTVEAAKRSQELSIGSSKLSDIVSEASKRSKEIAAEASKRAEIIKVEASKKADQFKVEASKRADQFKEEAFKRADQIKFQIPAAALTSLVESGLAPVSAEEVADLEKFGVTDQLREFVKEITINTFQDFPMEDDSELSDIQAVSNIRQDLTDWQEKHAKLVLSTVKEISKLRYQLCPRVMKERKFWRIYFILVNSHVAPYEKKYMEEERHNKSTTEEVKGDAPTESSKAGTPSKMEVNGTSLQEKRTTSAVSEHDLDVFLLGDLGDSDDGPDDGGDEGDFDDDFDKI